MTTDRHMQVAAELLEAARKRAAEAESQMRSMLQRLESAVKMQALAMCDACTLAAEVRAWRSTFDEQTGKQIGDSSDCRDVSAARAVTDECGALQRAKEAK
jgi:hypothetical protein